MGAAVVSRHAVLVLIVVHGSVPYAQMYVITAQSAANAFARYAQSVSAMIVTLVIVVIKMVFWIFSSAS